MSLTLAVVVALVSQAPPQVHRGVAWRSRAELELVLVLEFEVGRAQRRVF